MSNWTKGPWSIKRGEVWSKAGDCLGVIYRTEAWNSRNKVRTEDQANAALISAAPDLYRALADLLTIADDEGIIGDNTTVPAARAALAKARGETP